MDILMVTPELAPYARATRAADVVAALAKALCQLDHRVTVAIPKYPGFAASGLLTRITVFLNRRECGPVELTNRFLSRRDYS